MLLDWKPEHARDLFSTLEKIAQLSPVRGTARMTPSRESRKLALLTLASLGCLSGSLTGHETGEAVKKFESVLKWDDSFKSELSPWLIEFLARSIELGVDNGLPEGVIASARRILESLKYVSKPIERAEKHASRGQSRQALEILHTIVEDRNIHRVRLAKSFAARSERDGFKRMFLLCADDLNATLELCGPLGRLFPKAARKIARFVQDSGGGN